MCSSISETLLAYLSLGVLPIPSSVSPTTTAIGFLVLWLIALSAVALGVLYIAILVIAHFPRSALPSENTYTTTTRSGAISEPRKLRHIREDPDDERQREEKVAVSVVVPAYNETERLPGMLNEAVDVLEGWQLASGEKATYEILVVDDGSRDQTADCALKFSAEKKVPEDHIRVCKLEKNRGKGGAVAHGMQRCRGDYIIFADADGASQFSDIKTLHASLTSLTDSPASPAIALGSRAHMVKSEAVVKRSFIRNFLMYSLHTLLYVFGIRTIRDTQCGFKMFTRSAVAQIFPFMHNEGWIFDVEVLILAERKGVKVAEVPISWHEVPGSKMELARDSVRMAIDLVVIRCAYMLGVYDDGRKASREKALRKKKES
ncbi:nucleotide-diphospho-sugar transferase [Lipomyces tetrasporus]|uniref:dolichyl-phosphate beta-glucosyltransferase n=1 Tax=Lipomyces tetrasporus TaxID=54092 RepID=A0AAD7QLD5_9ASCO|nr:nucleotide-diphospho-sugar transferase [Lipomyces tetrasporus]KAJ8097426.1 nucleotide-diphospho-sugar transferase [Lipomyces tetrasporus]